MTPKPVFLPMRFYSLSPIYRAVYLPYELDDHIRNFFSGTVNIDIKNWVRSRAGEALLE